MARHANSVGATLSLEWAFDSSLQRQPRVHQLAAKFRMERRKVAGCSMGLTSVVGKTQGELLCKAWGIWTNHPSLSLALKGPHVRCSGGHPSVPVGGADTEHSGSYPDALARLVHLAITTTADDVPALVESQRWRGPLGSPTTLEGGDGCIGDQPGLTPAGAGTEEGRRCRKPAFLCQSVGGASRQRDTVEPCLAASSGRSKHLVAQNRGAVSGTRGLLNPTRDKRGKANYLVGPRAARECL